LQPSESAEIKVTFNAANKMGRIAKSVRIYSNDKTEPIKKIMIYATVVEREMVAGGEHSGIVMEGNYFKGKCISCHVAKGIDKYGKALFDADCAKCHGEDGKGVEHIAKSLVQPEFINNLSDKVLYGLIAKGTSNIMMLGFAKENGGPLEQNQIESLVEYIQTLNEN